MLLFWHNLKSKATHMSCGWNVLSFVKAYLMRLLKNQKELYRVLILFNILVSG